MVTRVQLRGRRRGAALLTTLLMLPAMLAAIAFATDLAVIVVEKQRLQSVVDASAAAGGGQFGRGGNPGAQAEEVARAYAKAHGYDLVAAAGQGSSAATLAAGSTEFICEGAPTRLDIQAQERVPTFFMRIFGIDGVTISAQSAVQQTDPQKDAVNMVEGTVGYRASGSDSAQAQVVGALAPFALNAALFRSGAWSSYAPSFMNVGSAQVQLAAGGQTAAPDFWIVDFGGARDRLGEYGRQGYDGAVQVGNKLAVRTGGDGMDTLCAALAERTGVGSDATTSMETSSWRQLSADRRVLIVPVARQSDNGDVVVDGFAAVQVSRIRGNTLQVQLVNVVAPQAEVDPSVKVQTAGSHYGLYGVRLVPWQAKA